MCLKKQYTIYHTSFEKKMLKLMHWVKNVRFYWQFRKHATLVPSLEVFIWISLGNFYRYVISSNSKLREQRSGNSRCWPQHVMWRVSQLNVRRTFENLRHAFSLRVIILNYWWVALTWSKMMMGTQTLEFQGGIITNSTWHRAALWCQWSSLKSTWHSFTRALYRFASFRANRLL